jgi:hypothetical protein
LAGKKSEALEKMREFKKAKQELEEFILYNP